jgi:diguanylate cyclase (GGDEF)-like protein
VVAVIEFLQLRVNWLPLLFAGTAALLAFLLSFHHFRRYRLLESAVENMWQGLAVFDADGRLIFHNPQFCALLGLPPKRLRGATTHREIVEWLVEAGGYEGRTAEEIWRLDAKFIARAMGALDYIDLPGRRTIAQSHEPLPDGGWVRTYADVTRRRQVEARIVHLAHHDALTDLPNRILFRERLDEALRSATPRSLVAVLLLDLNRFKEVNDTLGHAAGDQLLMRVADRVSSVVRDRGVVARLGGDEFAIVGAAMASKAEALELAEGLVAACDLPYELNGVAVSVGVSIGLSFAPEDGGQTDLLLKCADEAMYRAKSEGKSGYRCFQQGGA